MIRNNLYDILIRPIQTEKATNAIDISKYILKIRSFATKHDVKNMLEKLYGVIVIKVNVMNYKSKQKVFKGIKGKRDKYRKAIVTCKKGMLLDFAAGVK